MKAFLQLLRVELRRYLRRRAVQLLMAACVAVPLVIGVVTILDTEPPSDTEIALIEDEAKANRQAELDYCTENPADYGIGSTEDDVAAACERLISDNFDDYTEYGYYDTLRLDDQQNDSGVAVASFLAILLLLAGTTFTGHDWNSGSVSNQLLFEPRRARVWAAKALVVTGGALVAAAVIMSAYWAVLGLVAHSRDTLATGDLLDALQMGWRSAGVAAAAALLGFVLTMLFRSTVATIGVLLGASVAGSLLLAAIGVSERWNPAVNLLALIDNGTTYYSEDACPTGPEVIEGDPDETYSYDSCELEVTFSDASLYLGSFLLVGGVASFVSFRRRDVP
ncbi:MULTISPECIES: ABC transporter permease [unclassified Nocardioides]|uniref:ABC transporter permease n=1 Tax=unclassified Nocardioides TaxID=2615069 RepID=UPI00070360C8|nr:MULTISPECIES: ABC transporter permease [unclassified Nocardioides]KRC48912.1 hypothetical protein ASE19_18550 [Nocardioides sp. Root79]KRC75311.1 hypothetical protein ASE20_20450 [Nocardioides sp. Root240]